MRQSLLIFISCALFGTFPLWLSAAAETLAITHVTVIDATGAAAKKDMTVLIAANRIAYVGPSAHTQFAAGTREIDGTGKFLIPGLWDMHVHLYDKEHFSFFATLFTANGVTGIRVMAGQPDYLEWRKEIEAGTSTGPRMSIASPLVDGRQSPRGGSIVVDNEAEAREAVRKIKQDGYNFIKVYTNLARDAYFGIEDESKKLNLTFAGHVPVSVTAWEASDAGQRSIEHLEGVAEYCSDFEDRREAKSNPEGYNPQKCAALFEEFRKNKTWQCPTLAVLRNNMALAMPNPELKNDPRLKYLPQQLREYWMMMLSRTPQSPNEAAHGKAYYELRLKIAGAEKDAGLDILAGTDTPNPFVYPGFGLHDELAYLVDAGLTPMQALQAATRNPARFLEQEKELGTIEAGKLADLVLLERNPLVDIHNTRQIAAVVQNGKFISKAEIEDMLSHLAAAAKQQ
jgi:hypothetical protein